MTAEVPERPQQGLFGSNEKKKEVVMIRHTVVFTLRHAKGSIEEQVFFASASILAGIPGVKRFEMLQEVSPKNDYSFGFSMEFDDQSAYDGYNRDPDHLAFVGDHWVVSVDKFLEIDYVPLAGVAR